LGGHGEADFVIEHSFDPFPQFSILIVNFNEEGIRKCEKNE